MAFFFNEANIGLEIQFLDWKRTSNIENRFVELARGPWEGHGWGFGGEGKRGRKNWAKARARCSPFWL